MKFHAFHFSCIWNRRGEKLCLLGFATGRVSYAPEYKWLYSFRLFILFWRIELLWKTRPLSYTLAGFDLSEDA